MDNFAAKLAAGNYNVDSKRLVTNVVSKDLIYFDYDESLDIGHDYAGMSINNETFQTRVDLGEVKGVLFVDKGRVIDVGQKLLPSYWFNQEAMGGDIFTLFRASNPNVPLHFDCIGENPNVRASVAAFGGYTDFVASAVRQVSMDFDAVDPTKVTINAKIDGGSMTPEDITVVITFGESTSNPVAEAWMADPNRLMPDALGPQGEWTGNPLSVITSSLIISSVEEAMEYIPFMDFGSYAIWTNLGQTGVDNKGIIHDYHGTIRDVENYKKLLVSHFDYTLTEKGGEPIYRRVIRARDSYGCYVELKVYYDMGFVLEMNLNYEVERFNTQDELNHLITLSDYPALPETDDLYGWFGEDDYFIQTENWFYFYDFSLYTIINPKYEDLDKATAYLEAYGAILETSGFERGINSDINKWEKETSDYTMLFSYNFDKAGNLQLLLRRNDFDDTETMKEVVEGAGFPTVDITTAEMIQTSDHTKFEYLYYGLQFDAMYRNTFFFDDNDQAKKFLKDYKDALLADGFEINTGTAYYVKDNLVFEPNEAAEGMVGLYFYILSQD